MIEVVADECEPGVAAETADVPLETLALGYEQIMKAILVLGHLEHDHRMLSAGDLKEYGHDIRKLLRAVVTFARRTGYADSRPATREDIEFLEHDAMVITLADAMVDVSASGRYDALGEFIGAGRKRPAGVVVETLERAVEGRHPHLRERPAAEIDKAINSAYKDEVVTTCQRWARALCRTYTLGLCGSRGQQLKGTVRIFLSLRDHELRTVAPRV
jgi:hypothetical protein